jgi:hypothetical protein
MKNKFWMDGKDFRDYLYKQIKYAGESPLVEIAVSLHDIAVQLAELNNHLPPLEDSE